MSRMRSQNYVTFYSPGTFVHEQTRREIDRWDVAAATDVARTIIERHNATPFAFQFSTRARSTDELDAKETERSPMYFLGGTVRSYSEVVRDNLPDEQILRENMRVNGWDRIIENTNSYRVTQPLSRDDVILAFEITGVDQ